jgi:hypothetical protein
VAPADDRTCGHVDAAGTVRGKGLSVADVFEVDDVIDPAATRDVVLAALETAGGELRPRHPLVHTW